LKRLSFAVDQFTGSGQPDSNIESQATREYLNGKAFRFEEPSGTDIVGSIPSKPADKALQKRSADVKTFER
jgi:hypothetical protein